MRILALILLFFFAQNVLAQYSLFEKFDKEAIPDPIIKEQPNIFYYKYLYGNSLTLIVSPDPSKAVVGVDVLYKIGSSSDYSDRTGMAYYFFQLMKNGDGKSGITQYGNLLRDYGAVIKSSFSKDYTRFTTTAPANLLSTILFVEYQRLASVVENLNTQVSDSLKEKLITELVEKSNKVKFRDENLLASKTLYPFAHPYSWPVTGYPGHFEAALTNDFKKFFIDRYGPNNMIISISGNVNPDVAAKMVDDYFGNLKTSKYYSTQIENTLNLLKLQEDGELNANRYLTSYLSVPNPTLIMKFLSASKYSSLEPYMIYIADQLSKGEDALLYKSLVKTGLAKSVKASQESWNYGGEFSIQIECQEGVKLSVIADSVFAIIRRNFSANEAFEKMFKMPAPDSEGKFVRPAIESFTIKMKEYQEQFFQNLDQSSARASFLSDFEFFKGDPKKFSNYFQEIKMSNARMIFEAAQRFLVDRNAVLMSIVPEDKKELAASSTTYHTVNLQTVITHATDKEIDTSKQQYKAFSIPKAGKLPVPSEPQLKITEFANGFSLVYLQKENSGKVDFIFRIKLADSINARYPYLPQILKSFLKLRFEKAMNGDLKGLMANAGISVNFIQDGWIVYAKLSTSGDDFMPVSEFFRALFTNFNSVPFDGDFQAIKSFKTDIPDYFNTKLSLFTGNARSYPNERMPDNFFMNELMRIGVSMFLERFHEIVRPDNTSLLVSGNMNNDHIKRELNEIFRIWNTTEASIILPETGLTKFETNSNLKVFVSNDSSVINPHVMVRYMAKPFGMTNDYIMADLINYWLGTYYQGPLQKLAASHSEITFVTGEKDQTGKKDQFSVTAGIDADLFPSGFDILMNNLQNMAKNPLSNKQMKKLKNAYIGSEIIKNENSFSNISLAFSMLDHELGSDYYKKWLKIVNKIKSKALFAYISDNIKSDNFIVYIIGDKSIILPNLKGYNANQIAELDKYGNTINK